MKKQHKINRRTFLGNSAKIAAAGIIFNKLNATTKKHTPWDGEIKVALVGCGGRGTGAAIQAIAADQDVRLVAIADVFEDQTEKCMQALVEKYGESEQVTVRKETVFIGFNGFKKAIDISDVVILATPPGFRPQHFSYAIKHNKHVFMEKPVATDIVGIKKVIEAGKLAVKNKLNVVVGLQRHYQRSYQKVKKLIDRGSIGDTYIGENTFLDNQVHMAHNVKLGKNCMIAGQVGFAGSTTIGNNVSIGGQAGVSGHLNIGNNVRIGGGSGVVKDIPNHTTVMGYPAVPLKDFLKKK